MLQQIAFALLACLSVRNQFLHHIQLMIAWEDDCLRCRAHLLAVHQLDFRFHLQADISLQQGQQHLSSQHLLPQIDCRVTVRIFRITAITDVACPIAALVEGQEERLFPLQLSCHHHLFQVYTEVSQYAIVELEQRFLGVAVIHILVLRVLHRLPSKLVLQFQCNHRDAVYRKYHINTVLILCGIEELARLCQNIGPIFLHQFLVQS